METHTITRDERDAIVTNLLRDLDDQIAMIIDWTGNDTDHTVLNLLRRSKTALMMLHSDVLEAEEA
jgi:hypothetical protein